MLKQNFKAGATDARNKSAIKKICLQLVRQGCCQDHENFVEVDLRAGRMGKLLGSEDEVEWEYQAVVRGNFIGAGTDLGTISLLN